ncbi:MAG TPA: amidohydrolase [Henriciella marina]|uniref:amidohydrolase family protein n=1 Tax=Henriciella sp. TaxID=1968823 RepID=UPI001807C226|nr:amidohydrolase family protein [Henriciella sp.]HIG23480.1 amidohydrolase [Henriciella sp.]HIK66213.1 amidohydrolase [Henriciella marina]
MIFKFAAIAASTSLVCASAFAQNLAIQNATLFDGETVREDATLVIRDGTVVAWADADELPSGLETIDAEGAWITPGIFTPFSRTGIVEVGAEDSTDDTSAGQSTFGAALDMSDGFNPASTLIEVTRLEGVTRMAVAPSLGSSLFGGQGFIATTTGEPGSIIEERAFTFINLGEGGAGIAGGSRPAAWATFRAALGDARAFPARYLTGQEGDVLNRVDAQALSRAARGDQLIMISASRESDIRQIIELKQDNPQLQIVILGAQEGWMAAEALADADIPVIIDPYDNLPSSFAQLGATQQNAARLLDAGVTTAFAYFDNSSHQARLILQSAGNAVGSGVDHTDALKAITSVPADIFGIDGAGRLTTGSLGDLVIWDGDPLEVRSAPVRIFIDGVEQPLESRQTKLRDRYLNLDESERPLAYKR